MYFPVASPPLGVPVQTKQEFESNEGGGLETADGNAVETEIGSLMAPSPGEPRTIQEVTAGAQRAITLLLRNNPLSTVSCGTWCVVCQSKEETE